VAGRPFFFNNAVVYWWRTDMYATGPWITSGVQNNCTPRLNDLFVAYMGTRGVQPYATSTQILYATDGLFPSSDPLIF
jgi:hypothetical protein